MHDAAPNAVSGDAAESRNGRVATRLATARIYSRTLAGIKLAGRSGSRRKDDRRNDEKRREIAAALTTE